MAPKRARENSNKGHDTSKFVSRAAQERHNDAIVKKIPIPERGFDLQSMFDKKIIEMIEVRKWKKFCSQPQAAVIPVVREFYANVPEHSADKVFVRGCQVSFNRAAINAFYETPIIENDEYLQFLNEQLDLDEVTAKLCPRGTEWKLSKGIPISFKANTIDRDVKAWYYFLVTKMLPCTHVSDITKERAILLYAIITGKSIDIGQLLYTSIMHTACNTRDGLWFPSLITGLCVRAGVVWDKGEELLQPKAPIDGTVINRMMKGLDDHSSPARPSLALAKPPSPVQPRRNLTMVERLEQLESEFTQFVSYKVKSDRAFEQMLRLNAEATGVDMTKFPSLPSPPFSQDQDEEEDA